MPWQFWLRGRGPGPLSQQVRNAIVDRYSTTDDIVGKLTMIRKSGKFAGRKVTHVRVFDATVHDIAISRYSDLDTDQESIRYTGRIEQGGYSYLDNMAKKARLVPDSSI